MGWNTGWGPHSIQRDLKVAIIQICLPLTLLDLKDCLQHRGCKNLHTLWWLHAKETNPTTYKKNRVEKLLGSNLPLFLALNAQGHERPDSQSCILSKRCLKKHWDIILFICSFQQSSSELLHIGILTDTKRKTILQNSYQL